VNDQQQLQSSSLIPNDRFYLSTVNKMAVSTEWKFTLQLSFNPSSANYVDAFLTASAADLSDDSAFGYFVRIGNADDEISLYRKDSDRSIIKIIDGENGILNHSSNVMRIKVIRNESNQWTLYRDVTATGNSFVKEGTAVDSAYLSSAYFGFLIKQSTSSFFQKHFFDDIEIQKFLPDLTAPTIVSVSVISSKEINILFDEPVDGSSIVFSDFSVDNGIGMPQNLEVDSQNHALIHLAFEKGLTNGHKYTLSVNNIKDLSGNVLDTSAMFSFNTAEQFDIIIDEIFPDPSPQVGLPNYEWIEIKNTSAFPINLKGWKISDISSRSGSFPEFILQPDSFLIVCSASALPALSSFGKAISLTGFPSLDNDGDVISIADANGKVIHAVEYSSNWYKSDLKKEGGWSLEMIDTKNPCSGATNWIACKDVSGGTPGTINSMNGNNADTSSPELLKAFATDPKTVTLVFNETVDSLTAATLANYAIDNELKAIRSMAIPPLFNKVQITFDRNISEGTVYTITAKNITDCSGNSIGSKNVARFGIAQTADSFDIIINEILFNPNAAGVDFVELYNRSGKIIDLSKMYLANRNSNNSISSIIQIISEPVLLFPKDFVVLTTDPDLVKDQYLTTNPGAFLKLKSMPSYPNDEGNVVVLNLPGNIVDEVSYSDKWHFPLITNSKGVSIERINYNGPSVQSNFHSAASSVGFATPGYKNSQNSETEELRGDITVTPKIFSPDNDGNDDFAIINYSFPSPGFVSNITIFDASGRAVRFLENNSLSGLKGFYRWDGLDDKNRKLPQGIYIIYTEVFNKEGKKKQFKNTIVLARRFGI
jgi:hypothetical protein